MTKPAAELIEDLEFLDSTGVGGFAAAERTGFRSAEAMEQWLRRHDAYDLWLSFKKRDPDGAHSQESRRAAAQAIAHPSRIDNILARAEKSPRPRLVKRAAKIRDLISTLGTDVEVAEAEDAEKEAARKEVERLERQLAEAKAKLRGKSPDTPDAKVKPTPIRVGHFVCKNEGCGRSFSSPQGKSIHERRHCERRERAAS